MTDNNINPDGKHIGGVVENNLCCFCGTCQGVCPVEAITIDYSDSFPVPVIDEARCTQCGLCRKVCPGHAVDVKALTEEFLEQSYDNPQTGYYRDCFTAAVCDPARRLERTSGGVAREVAIWGLENKQWDRVVVSQDNDAGFCRTTTLLAKTAQDVERAAGSLYCPVTCGTVIRQIKEVRGRVCYIGLPCHIEALRKAQRFLPWLREKVCFTVGLFCSGTPGVDATRYFLKAHRIDPEAVASVVYRSAGWPGDIQIRLKDSDRVYSFPRGKANSLMDHLTFAAAFHQGGAFFHPRCSLCPDYFAELADISLGDAWKLGLDARSGGWNAGLVRTVLGQTILDQLKQADRIIYNSLPAEELVQSHRSSLRSRKNLQPVMELHARSGFWTPVFSGQPAGNNSTRLRLLHKMRQISRNCAQSPGNWRWLKLLTVLTLFVKKLIRQRS